MESRGPTIGEPNLAQVVCRTRTRVWIVSFKNDDEDRVKLFTDFIVRRPLNDAIRAIEITFLEINSWRPPLEYWMESVLENSRLKPDAAIDKLNERFKENGLEYEFRNSRLMNI